MNTITVCDVADVCVVRYTDPQLTTHDIDDFLLTMNDIIQQRPKTHVVLDINAVQFIDSSAMVALVQLMKHAVRAGGNLSLACLQPGVQRMFSMSRLDAVIKVNAAVPQDATIPHSVSAASTEEAAMQR